MQDDALDSVTVSVNQRGPIVLSQTNGVYIISYTVVFDSETLRGKLAPLTVHYSDVVYSPSVTTATFNAYYRATTTTYNVGNGGGLNKIGATAYQDPLMIGSQPDGYAELKYTCESTTWTPTSVTVYYPGNLVYVNQAAGNTALAKYMYIRLQTTYHQVIATYHQSYSPMYYTVTPYEKIYYHILTLPIPPTLPCCTPGHRSGCIGRLGPHQVADLPVVQEDRPARHLRLLLRDHGGLRHAGT